MSYLVVEADLSGHRREIETLWKAAGVKDFASRFDWLYLGNPAGPARVWLARHAESGECVGSTAVFPRRFRVHGESAVAGIAGDLLVLPRHRGFGPAIMLQKEVLSAADRGSFDFVYGFPNAAAEPLFKRLPYRVLGRKAPFVKVVRCGPYLARLRHGSSLGSWFGPIIDQVRSTVSFETWKRLPRGTDCREPEDWQEVVPGVCARSLENYHVCGERSPEYLAWKYRVGAFGNRVFAIQSDGPQSPQGFLVYRATAASVEVRDFCFSPGESAFLVLMAAFLRHVRATGAQRVAVSCLPHPSLSRLLRAAGLSKRPDSGNVYLYIPPGRQELAPLLLDPSQWLLLQSDDDT